MQVNETYDDNATFYVNKNGKHNFLRPCLNLIIKLSVMQAEKGVNNTYWDSVLTQPPARISANKGMESSFSVNLSLTKSFTCEKNITSSLTVKLQSLFYDITTPTSKKPKRKENDSWKYALHFYLTL